MFTTRTVSELLSDLSHDETAHSMTRLIIATYLLSKMIDNGGLKADKVRAAFEYADMLLTNNLTDMVMKDREWQMKAEEK